MEWAGQARSKVRPGSLGRGARALLLAGVCLTSVAIQAACATAEKQPSENLQPGTRQSQRRRRSLDQGPSRNLQNPLAGLLTLLRLDSPIRRAVE